MYYRFLLQIRRSKSMRIMECSSRNFDIQWIRYDQWKSRFLYDLRWLHKLPPQANNVKIWLLKFLNEWAVIFWSLGMKSLIVTSHYIVANLGQQKQVSELDHWCNWVTSTSVTSNPILDTPKCLLKWIIWVQCHLTFTSRSWICKSGFGPTQIHQVFTGDRFEYNSQILIVEIMPNCACFSFQRDNLSLRICCN